MCSTNTGVLLSVTPHINDKGLVRMEVSQEVSELSDKQVQGISSPIFSKRKAETVLAVQDGQTIVIGGLIRKSRTDNYSGIPLLSKVPLLRNLVGYQNTGWVNTELMLFITPHVVAHDDDAAFISRRFLQRLHDVRKRLVNHGRAYRRLILNYNGARQNRGMLGESPFAFGASGCLDNDRLTIPGGIDRLVRPLGQGRASGECARGARERG